MYFSLDTTFRISILIIMNIKDKIFSIVTFLILFYIYFIFEYKTTLTESYIHHIQSEQEKTSHLVKYFDFIPFVDLLRCL